MNAPHPTQELVLHAAIKVLREHAAGRSVDPQRLDWAVTLATQNPRRIYMAQVAADTSHRAVVAHALNLAKAST